MSRRPVVLALLELLLVALVLGASPAGATAPLANVGSLAAAPTARAAHRPASTDARRPHRSERVLSRDTVAPVGRSVRKWPGHTIRYWAKLPAGYQWSLAAALRAWNDTGMHMRFVKASKSRARLAITIGDTQGADGLATVGFQAHNWVHLRPGLVEPVYDESDAYARVVAAHIIAHELGHNLGLEHTRGCQLMTPILFLPRCRMMDADQPGYYACRIVDSHALAKTVALYGGRRKQARAACAVDTLPPDLSGATFRGGLDADAPVRLTWDPPSRAPAGSRVLALTSRGAACRFPVVQDFYGEAAYDASSVAVKDLDPGKGSWAPPTDGVERHCYALLLVNRSGAGSRMSSKALDGWVPQPGAPVVTQVRRYRGSGREGYYQAVATWDPHDGDLAVLARPAGQCPTSWPAGEDVADHLTYAQPGEPFEVEALDGADQPILNACLSFVVVRSDGARTSDVETWQVATEAAPEPPVVNTVKRYYDDYYTVDATWDYAVASLAVLVRPQGQCVTTWPGGDPTPYLLGEDGGNEIDASGIARPCLSFFTVNATDGLSPVAVTWQVAAAPAPPTPAITALVDDGGSITGRTDLDPDVFGLAVVEGPTGECATSLPDGADPRDYAVYLYEDNGHISFETYAYDDHPCLTFFAFNDDGDLGPGVPKQL